jgi:hypothetical protein
MTTSYLIPDVSPRDAGGAKMLAPINISSSQSDFALFAGIGASTIGATSKIHAALQVGTHVAGSPVTNAPVGVMNVFSFTTNASSMGTNNAMAQRGNQFGAAYTTGLSTTTCAMSGSTETVTTTCGTLYMVMCAGCGVVAGGQVAIMNGGTSLAHLVFDSANGTLPILDLGNTGTCFSSLRFERRNTVGTVYVSFNYQPGFSQ